MGYRPEAGGILIPLVLFFPVLSFAFDPIRCQVSTLKRGNRPGHHCFDGTGRTLRGELHLNYQYWQGWLSQTGITPDR